MVIGELNRYSLKELLTDVTDFSEKETEQVSELAIGESMKMKHGIEIKRVK